jgi:assimilatory nitrate reductase catalytic subunit
MHFPDVNKLTFPAYDPHSRQPSYKACAVTVAPIHS